MKNLKTLLHNKLFFIIIILWLVCGSINYMLIMFKFKYELLYCLSLSLLFGIINYFITITYYEKYDKVKNINNKLMQCINTDELTGLFNRRALNENMSKINNLPFYSIIFTDIDNFREFNNSYGHDIGDIVLKKVSEVIKVTIGDKGSAYRYGGEEIVIVLFNCNKDDAKRTAEEIRARILNIDNTPYPNITMSLGVSSYPEDGTNIDIVLNKADNALLSAKESGKNCTVSSCQL